METNISKFENWPSVKTDYAEAYGFEIFDLSKTRSLMGELRPWAAGLSALYILAVFGGQAYMKSRPAYRLKGPLIAWNGALALYSIATFVRCWPELWYYLSQPNGFYLSVCSNQVHNYAVAFWSLLFVISKVVEFGDTAFIILRKQKLIFLHWYHHAITLWLSVVMFQEYDPFNKYPVVMNSFVHSWMYSYYALKALKIHIPEKIARFITTMQITQMSIAVMVNVYTLYILENDVPCNRTKYMSYRTFAASGVFFLLFVSFFFKRYVRGSGKDKKA